MQVPRDTNGRTANLVSARGLGIARGGQWLVHDVDLDVRRGEILTMIGPNGAGKTTTAKALLGLIAPSAGKVTRAPGLTVGYVPQRLAPDWTLPLTVRRLMTLTGRHGGAAVAQALDQVGIAHLADARVQALSGGELQRALLARAIVRGPDLLVLDEPVQGVDFSGEIALYDLIRRIRDDLGCGILLISHDLHLVMRQSDTVLCLSRHVCCQGTPEAVAESPEYRRLFGPRAAEALAVYHHHHDHVHEVDGSVTELGAGGKAEDAPHRHSGGGHAG